jgi:radical SAM superfamily enzyme YgiQ (UPF0313 family)
MRKQRLVLAVPNFRWCEGDDRFFWHMIPYNLCLLAAMVEDLCEVSIIDAYTENMDKETFFKKIEEIRPDVVGLTVLIDQCAPAGFLAAKLIKDVSKEIKVIVGGVFATVNPDLVIADGNIDFAVIGEGEYVLRDLMGYFSGTGSLPEKGICFRNGGSIENRGRADLIENLDALPRPAYHLIDYPKYTQMVNRKSVDSPTKLPYARVLTSRGCPFHCVFCQVEKISGSKFRPRSAEHVLNEIAWLKEKYDIQSVLFDDDNLFRDRQRAVDLFRGMIKRGLAMPWKTIATAVFYLDEELVDLMRESGCQYIDVAIESGSKRVLKEIIHKPLDLDQAKRMVDYARKKGIYVAANFIVGFPTETWDEIRQTLDFAEVINADYVKLFGAIPLRHTRLWELCEKEGIFKNNRDITQSSWNVGQIETEHFRKDDLTILRAYEWDRINFTDPEKRRRTAEMLHVNEEELYHIRRDTLEKAVKQIKHQEKAAAN